MIKILYSAFIVIFLGASTIHVWAAQQVNMPDLAPQDYKTYEKDIPRPFLMQEETSRSSFECNFKMSEVSNAENEIKNGNIEKARNIYDKLCKENCMLACSRLGLSYYGDWEKALPPLNTACKKGEDTACVHLSYIAREVFFDYDKAQKFCVGLGRTVPRDICSDGVSALAEFLRDPGNGQYLYGEAATANINSACKNPAKAKRLYNAYLRYANALMKDEVTFDDTYQDIQNIHVCGKLLKQYTLWKAAETAIVQKDTKKLEEVFENGFDIKFNNIISPEGTMVQTLLWKAIEVANIDAVVLLLKKDMDPTVVAYDIWEDGGTSYSALDYARRLTNPEKTEIAKLILGKAESINYNTLLWLIREKWNTEATDIIKQKKFNLNSPKNGYFCKTRGPLAAAAEATNTKILPVLFEYGANPEEAYTKTGELCHAVYDPLWIFANDAQAVSLFFKNGRKPSCLTSVAMIAAIVDDASEAVKIFMQYNINPYDAKIEGQGDRKEICGLSGYDFPDGYNLPNKVEDFYQGKVGEKYKEMLKNLSELPNRSIAD